MSGGNASGGVKANAQSTFGAGGAGGLFGVAPGPNMFGLGTQSQPQAQPAAQGATPWMGQQTQPTIGYGGWNQGVVGSMAPQGYPAMQAPTAPPPPAPPAQPTAQNIAEWDWKTHYMPGMQVMHNGNTYRATDYQGPNNWNENAMPEYGGDTGGIEEHKMWERINNPTPSPAQPAPVQSQQPALQNYGQFAGVAPAYWQTHGGLAKGGIADLLSKKGKKRA